MVIHRCVIAVIGVLAFAASANAGPIKFGDQGPSLDVTELRASGVRMSSRELRAIFFRGADPRATASCAECLTAESSLSTRERSSNSSYHALFPLSSSRLHAKKPARSASTRSVPDLLTGLENDAVAAEVPLSGSELVPPLPAVGAAAIPEPASVILIGTGLTGVWLMRRRSRSAA